MGKGIKTIDLPVDVLLEIYIPPGFVTARAHLVAHHPVEQMPIWQVLGRKILGESFVSDRYYDGGTFSATKFLKDLARTGFTLGQLADTYDNAGFPPSISGGIRGVQPGLKHGDRVNQLVLPRQGDPHWTLVNGVRQFLSATAPCTGQSFWMSLANDQFKKHDYGSFVPTPYLYGGVLNVDDFLRLMSSKPFYVTIAQLADEFERNGLTDPVRAIKLLAGYDASLPLAPAPAAAVEEGPADKLLAVLVASGVPEPEKKHAAIVKDEFSDTTLAELYEYPPAGFRAYGFNGPQTSMFLKALGNALKAPC
jgi:hypothetical protein